LRDRPKGGSNSNPVEGLSNLTKPEENLALIMKDEKIYKNTVK